MRPDSREAKERERGWEIVICSGRFLVSSRLRLENRLFASVIGVGTGCAFCRSLYGVWSADSEVQLTTCICTTINDNARKITCVRVLCTLYGVVIEAIWLAQCLIIPIITG